jgi:hypothetical protein
MPLTMRTLSSLFTRATRGAVLVFTVSALLTVQLPGQTQEGGAVSKRMLYRHFLAHVALLDADTKPISTLDSRRPIDLYPSRVGLPAAKFSQVRAIARHLDAAIRAKDEQAREVIRRFRLSIANQQTSGGQLPPPPPELGDLQRQRDQLIQNCLDLLAAQLGPTDAARLDTFVEQVFAPKARVQRVAIPRSYDPGTNPLPPLERQDK